jgi:hypothetical protein
MQFSGSAGGRWVDAPVWYGESSNPDEAVIVSRPSEWQVPRGSSSLGNHTIQFPDASTTTLGARANVGPQAARQPLHRTSPIEFVDALSAMTSTTAPTLEWIARVDGTPVVAKQIGRLGGFASVIGFGVSVGQGDYRSAAIQATLGAATVTAAVFGYPVLAAGIGVAGLGFAVVEVAIDFSCRAESGPC